MFIVALFTNMEIWKHPPCPLIDQGQAYLAGYYCSALEKERNSYIKCYIDESSRHCARWDELVTQEQALYGYIDMRYTVYTKSYRQDWMVVGKPYGL